MNNSPSKIRAAARQEMEQMRGEDSYLTPLKAPGSAI